MEVPAGAVGLIEPLALAAARESAPGQVAEVMRGFTHALDPDAADEAAVRQYEQRGLSAATTLGGMVAGRFLLDPVAGSALLTAIDAGAPLEAGDRRTAPQRRADGLGEVVRHFLASGDAPRTAGARPHVIVTTGSTPGMPEPASQGSRLCWVGLVPDSTAERVACDAQVTVVGVDPDGSTGELTRHRRFFTWNQRLAMIARDGDQCPWPWCTRPVWWTHGPHLVPVADGGPTTDIGPEPNRRVRGMRPPPRRRE